MAVLKIYFLCSFDVSCLCTLSYLSLKKLSLKLIIYVLCSTSSFLSNCSARAHVLAHRSQEAHANPLSLLLGGHKKALDPALSIHHPLLAHEEAVQSRDRVFPVTFKMVQQITIPMRSPEMAILPALSSLKKYIHNADEIPLRSFFFLFSF